MLALHCSIILYALHQMAMENHLLSATSMKDTTMFVVLITVVALVSRGFDWVRETALSR
jgi:hypothetical protein